MVSALKKLEEYACQALTIKHEKIQRMKVGGPEGKDWPVSFSEEGTFKQRLERPEGQSQDDQEDSRPGGGHRQRKAHLLGSERAVLQHQQSACVTCEPWAAGCDGAGVKRFVNQDE